MYLSLMKCGLATTGGRGLTAFLAVGLLALVGGLAAITFVRLTGIVLAGFAAKRSRRHAHESSPWMLAPMAILVFLCLTVAVVPQTVARLAPGRLGPGPRQACRSSLPGDGTPSEAPLVDARHHERLDADRLRGGGGRRCRVVSRTASTGGRPDLGLRIPHADGDACNTPGRSFAEMMAEHLLPRFLRPRTTGRPPAACFLPRVSSGRLPRPVSEKVYEPFFRRWADRFSRLRILQQGKVHVYLVYIVLMVVLALAWVSIRR